MTVSELKNFLSELPGDMPVMVDFLGDFEELSPGGGGVTISKEKCVKLTFLGIDEGDIVRFCLKKDIIKYIKPEKIEEVGIVLIR